MTHGCLLDFEYTWRYELLFDSNRQDVCDQILMGLRAGQ